MGYDPSDPEWPKLPSTSVSHALLHLDIDMTLDNVQQLMVFTRAMQIYQQREKKRGGIWKEFGPEDKLMHLRDKLRRVERVWENSQHNDDDPELVDLDDAYDILNYTAFFIRQMEGK